MGQNCRPASADFSCSRIVMRFFSLSPVRNGNVRHQIFVTIMLVLVDESGDAGFKITRGSSPHFVVAMVIFHDLLQAEAASRAIGEARLRLRVKPEFKFNKSAPPVRDGFFEAVSPFDFSVRALVVDKSRIYSDDLRRSADNFYSYFVRLLLKHDIELLAGARLKIDGRASREFRTDLAKFLREHLAEFKVENIKFVESHRDNLVQLADMVAGAIARSYRLDVRKDADRWRQMLTSKIVSIREFGG